MNNNNDEILNSTIENEFEDNALSLFKEQFQEAARDLCFMLSMFLNINLKI